MSNDQRPKKMAVYSGDAPKAAPAATARSGGTAAAAGSAQDLAVTGGATEGADEAQQQAAAASGSGLPIWAIALYLVAGTGAGGALVALLPRYAPQLLHAA